jgi:glycerophosphoryl diester phosphodiesterase
LKKKLKKDEMITLQQLVWKAHAKGRQVRFYAAGNNPKLWKQLHHADVDWINVDKLKDYTKFAQSDNKKQD